MKWWRNWKSAENSCPSTIQTMPATTSIEKIECRMWIMSRRDFLLPGAVSFGDVFCRGIRGIGLAGLNSIQAHSFRGCVSCEILSFVGAAAAFVFRDSRVGE